MKNSHKLIAAVAAALAANNAYGILLFDGFDYPAGALAEVTAGSPPVYTGRTSPFGPTWHVAGASTTDTITVTAPTLNGPTAWTTGVGNSAEWAGPATGGNATRIELGPFSGPGVGGYQQTKYYSMALQINDVSVLNPGTSIVGNILGGFNTVSGPQANSPSVIGTRFLARQHPDDATRYQLGMSKNSNLVADVVWDPRQFNVGDTQFVVGNYTLVGTGADANDNAQLWINPAPATFGAAVAPTPDINTSSGNDLSTNRIESFLLRQSGPAATGATNTGIRIDEVRVDDSWAGVAPGDPNVYTGGQNGVWGNPAHWSKAASPNAAGEFVSFPAGAGTIIQVNAPATAGTLHFLGGGYDIGNPGTLTLDGSSSIVVFAGTHGIHSPLNIPGNLNVTVATGQSIQLSNMTTAPTTILTKSGYGSAIINRVRGDRLNLFGGRLSMMPDSSANGVSVVNFLDLPIFTDVARPTGFVFDPGPRGTLDLKRNKLIVQNGALGTWNGTNYTGAQGLVRKGLNGGAWDGTGIVTSEADALNNLTTIGSAVGAQVQGLGPTDTGIWAGQTITGNSVLLMYTYAGDLNLDGQINADDYANIDFNAGTPGAAGYYNGDINYDGAINADDYATIDFNNNAQGAPIFAGGAVEGVAAVPEAAACGLAGLAVLTLAQRRRRARCT